jgi:hypothetical protein
MPLHEQLAIDDGEIAQGQYMIAEQVAEDGLEFRHAVADRHQALGLITESQADLAASVRQPDSFVAHLKELAATVLRCLASHKRWSRYS